jgi:hypothetical protein
VADAKTIQATFSHGSSVSTMRYVAANVETVRAVAKVELVLDRKTDG